MTLCVRITHCLCFHVITANRDSFRGWEYGDLSSLRSIPLSSILNYTSSRVILKYWGVRTISPTWRSSNCINPLLWCIMCTLQPLQAKDWGSTSLSPLCGLHATWWNGGAEQRVSEEDAQCGQIITKAQRTSVWKQSVLSVLLLTVDMVVWLLITWLMCEYVCVIV